MNGESVDSPHSLQCPEGGSMVPRCMRLESVMTDVIVDGPRSYLVGAPGGRENRLVATSRGMREVTA
jgi:hypothetical protein